jgi:CRP-like cAMP-binding protein
LLQDFLRRVKLFADLDGAQLDRLAGALQEERVPAFHLVFREGEPVDALVLIKEGMVMVGRDEADEPQQALARLEEGDFFGEPGLLNDKARHYASARAVTPSVLLRIAKPDLVALLTAWPELELKLRAEISRRHGRQVSALLGLAGQRDVRIRLGLDARVEMEDGAVLSAVLETLSLGGLSLSRVPDRWHLGMPLRFSLGRSGEPALLQVAGSVVWREGDAVGIAFDPEAAGKADLVHGALRRFLEDRR